MNILALEPYFGGSHKDFLKGWGKYSRHNWTLITLPPYKWKWRMRHAAVTFAQKTNSFLNDNKTPDLLFCSDMLNLAEFRGLANPALKNVPSLIYFHENQLTYPNRFESERDYQFVFTNFTSALAADAVWFNSSFHRDDFLSALKIFLKKMPDYQPLDCIKTIKQKSSVYHPGIASPSISSTARSVPSDKKSPPTILWAARWEHDKNPEDFFKALNVLKKSKTPFKINVIGESFRQSPKIFEKAKKTFADNINLWGYQKSRTEYKNALAASDIIVSTANHEFFGITVLEAIAARCFPLLPKRLAYPELLSDLSPAQKKQFFYDGSVDSLAKKLVLNFNKINQSQDILPPDSPLIQLVKKFFWKNNAPILDNALEKLIRSFT